VKFPMIGVMQSSYHCPRNDESEREPIAVEEGEIQCVKEFPYLGSVIADSERRYADVECRVAKASKAFGALRKAVFLDRNISLRT